MLKNLKWIRLTPDSPGRGGIKSGLHTFQQEPVNDTYFVSGAHVYEGAWRRSYDSVSASANADVGNTSILAIHGYTYPSLTDPSAAPGVTLLGHTRGAQNHIYDYTGNAIRYTRNSNSDYPATFLNVNQRCFAFDGSGEGMVMDDRTPAIHTQKNQNLGIGAPTQALSLYNGQSFSSVGSGYCTKSSAYINHPNPNNLISTIVTTDTVAASAPNGSLSVASGAVTVAGVSSNTVAFSAPGTISITSGTSLVTLTGGTWPANGAYCGLAINFNGYSFVIAETNQASQSYDIDGNSIGLSSTQLLILGVYDGPTYSGAYTITGAQVKLTTSAAGTSYGNSGSLGYNQLTQSNLIPVLVLAVRSNGLYRNLGNISMGPAGGGTRSTVTDARMASTLNQVTSASNPFSSTDVGKTIVVDNGVAANGLLITTITSSLASNYVTTADVNSSGGTITNVRAWWGTGFISCNDAAITIGTKILTSASNPWVSSDVGKTIMIEKAGTGGTTALYTSITAFTSAGQVTVADNAIATVSANKAVWGGGTANATVGPTYAYAWYDPETGAMSNISPTFQIPKPTIIGSFADFANITPQFQVDPGFISYPSGVDATRFSHVVFFRTLSTGGSTLYPIGSLQPFVGKVHPGGASTRGSWNPTIFSGWAGYPNQWASPTIGTGQIWYDFSSDSDLLLAGGFRAPQFTNNKPVALLRGGAAQPAYPYLAAFWDGRLWLIPTQEPDKILFSCDAAQCPLGVPEESFPATNYLRLPSLDGRGTGMRVVGDMLLIATTRMAYVVAGNNESNYRLLKISAAMPSVGTYQMDEFPTYSGAEGEPVTLFYLGTDWKVYEWTVGGPVRVISRDIQITLDNFRTQFGGTASNYTSSRLHCISTAGRRLVVLTLAHPTQTKFWIYDIDAQVWTVESPTSPIGVESFGYPVSMATIFGSTPPISEIYGIYSPGFSAGLLRNWMKDDVATTSNGLSIQTFPLNFDGKKTRKQLVFVNLHATAGTYQLIANVNESTVGAAATFGAYSDPLYSIYATPSAPIDTPSPADLVVQQGQFQTDGTPLVGYRFQISVSRSDSTPAKIWAIDIGYVDMEEPGEGDP